MTLLFSGRQADIPEDLKVVNDHRSVFDNGDLVCPPPNYRTMVVGGVQLRQSCIVGNIVITKAHIETQWVMRDPKRFVTITRI